MTDLINDLIVLLSPVVEKLERGEKLRVMEIVAIAAQVWKIVSEYMSTRPVIADAESFGQAWHAPSSESVIESFGGEQELADLSSRLAAVVTGEAVTWRPDGHLLKQILPLLLKLLPLII